MKETRVINLLVVGSLLTFLILNAPNGLSQVLDFAKAQNESNASKFKLSGNISDDAIKLANYHLDLARQELNKIPENRTGFWWHIGLGMSQQGQLMNQNISATITENDLNRAAMDAGNCVIIVEKGQVSCMN
jgi:hypothetical protein